MQISTMPEPKGHEAGGLKLGIMPDLPFFFFFFFFFYVLGICIWGSKEEDVLGRFPWRQALDTDFVSIWWVEGKGGRTWGHGEFWSWCY